MEALRKHRKTLFNHLSKELNDFDQALKEEIALRTSGLFYLNLLD